MKKFYFLLSFVLIFTIFLTGCGLPGLEAEEAHRERLNLADWPTPIPESPTPSPTPFPKTTLAPASAAVSKDTTPAPATSAKGLEFDGLNFGGNTAELAEQISLLTGGLTPIGAALITGGNTAIHQEPADTAEVLDTLDQNEITAVLGKDTEGNWIYVFTPSLVQGWLPLDKVRLVGNLAEAPVLSPDQLAAASTQPIITSATDINTLLEAAAGQTNIFSELTASGTAIVIVAGTSLRSGPSTAYGTLEILEQGEVAGIFGKNPTGDWVYIATLAPSLGWLPVENLRILGDLETARILPPDPIAAFLNRPASSASTGRTAGRQLIDPADLEAIATAQVSNALLNLRQRPGGDYKLLETLAEGDEVTILALNRDKEWVLVKTAGGQLGWGSLDFLTVDDSLDQAPQVITLAPEADQPAGEVAPMAVASGSGPVGITTTNTGSATANVTPANAVVPSGKGVSIPSNTLAPVAAGLVIEKIDTRRGPGLSYGQLHPLTVDEPVTIRGVNGHRDWAIAESTNRRIGWLPVTVIKISEGSLDNAPQVLSAWVKSNELEILNGPGIYYETIGVVNINNLVSVLALNEGRNWALIETMSGGQGWIPVRFLEISGSLNEVPEISVAPQSQSSGADQAVPAPSGPPGGKLVVQLASGGDIMLINADGTGLQPLTTGIDPVLSPDGQQVAFTRWQGDNGSLWAINTDGTNERVILPEVRKPKGPDWSPDGSQIILNYQHGGRLEDKRLCRNAEDQPNIPRNATDIGFAISSKMKFQICWTIPPDEQWGLRVVNVADGTAADKYGGLYAFRPAFDPSRGWRVVSDSGNGLLAVDINRDDYREPLTDNRADGSPVISPDGRFIAVTADVQGGHDIFRMNADGTGRVRLTQTPLWVPVQPDSNSKQWSNVAPAWSPDGSQIAFLTNRTGRWEIWIMNVDGANQRPMFSKAINDQLNITYNFVDERVLSWR